MNKIHTHYDNLRVAQNAPAEVIQAAYRALCLKYHPDRNPDNPEAGRIMAVVNAAYAVLSDPAKRAEHDQWIAQREAALGQAPGQTAGKTAGGAAGQPHSSSSTSASESASASGQSAGFQSPGDHSTGHQSAGVGAASQSASAKASARSASQQTGASHGGPSGPAKASDAAAHVRKYWFLYVAAVLLLWKVWWTNTPQKEPPPQTTQAAPQRPAASIKRAATKPADYPATTGTPDSSGPSAPSGSSDPSAPSRQGEQLSIGKLQGPATGRCRVVMDNRQGGAPLVARLVRLEDGRAEVVREFPVPARGQVNVQNVQAGTYEMRYRNPSTGVTKKTEPFTLHESQTPEGTRSDVLTLTTYSVSNGNMRTVPIGEEEF